MSHRTRTRPRHRSRLVRLLTLALLLPCVLGASGADDEWLERYAETFRFRNGRPGAIRVTPDGDAVLFLRSGPRSFVRDLYELRRADGSERRLLDAAQLLGGETERLSAEELARRERMRLAARGIASFELSNDGRRVLVPLGDRLFVLERADGRVTELPRDGGAPIDARFSPDGRLVACVRDGELYVIDVAAGRQRRLTSGAGGTVAHGTAEFVAQEEMGRRHGYWWSPDSRRLVYQRTDDAALETMYIMDATRPERPPASWRYPRPGKANSDVRLGLIDATGGETTWIDRDRAAFEYLVSVDWPAAGPLTIAVQNRSQTELRLLEVDPASGATKPLVVERDEAWVEIDQAIPLWLPDGRRFLWLSEADGEPRLQLRGRDGALLRALTPPGFGLRGLVGHRPAYDDVAVLAAADPTQTHVWTVSLDARAARPRRLTEAPGVHSLVLGTSGRVGVLGSRSPAAMPSWRIIDAEGRAEHELRSAAESPGFVPRTEFVTLAGEPALEAVVIRPRTFDPTRRYPLLVHVYGGPTSQMVRRDASRYLLDQWVADRGFVVAAIDGRGTPGRGRAWQRAVAGDLSTLPLEDQARGVRALVARFPEIDGERVGIWGWSFGGYMAAMAVTRAGDTFRAGFAGAPVVDWRDYDTHYTERYLRLPRENPAGYRVGNVLTHAAALERPLLLVHGTADDNVYLMHSLKLADALFRAGRSFELVPLAGATHMVRDPAVTRRLWATMTRFFERHLGPPRSIDR